MRYVAVTGGMGSGKSTVCEAFALLGIPVFHADAEAKRCMAEDGQLRERLQERFGKEVLTPGGVDRARLASIIFSDPHALQDMNGMVHPAVRSRFRQWARAQHAPYVLMESAILADTGGHADFDAVVVVSAPEELRIQRCMDRDGSSRDQVLARMRNQAPEEERLRIAHHVIVNDDRHMVLPQVLAIHEQLLGGR